MKGRGRTRGIWWTCSTSCLAENVGREGGEWIHAQWALAVYQLPRMSTSHQHWLLERDRNKPLSRAMVSVRRNESEPGRSKKQVHSAILSSSLVSPFRQIKKLRIRVNDSPKIPQLVYGRAEFGLSSVQEKSHTLLCQHGRCLTSLGYICKVGVRC